MLSFLNGSLSCGETSKAAGDPLEHELG